VVFNKLVPNHIRHGQRAVVVALFTCHPVELFGQRLRDRDSKADDACGFRVFHERDGSKGT